MYSRTLYSGLSLVAFMAAGIQGFAPSSFGIARVSSLGMAVESMADIRKSIKDMTKDNFSDSLKDLEPALVESGSSIYRKSMKRIARRAKELGETLSDDFAKEAKATLKKRTKQDEFIKVKEEERIAAEEEAAAAAEAEAPAEEPEEATEEEPAPVEA